MGSLVGSLEPLAVSLHDYPMSDVGNTSTGEEAAETWMHPEESVQTGILRDARVYKETVACATDHGTRVRLICPAHSWGRNAKE